MKLHEIIMLQSGQFWVIGIEVKSAMPTLEVKMRLINEKAMPQVHLKMSQLDKSVCLLAWKRFNDTKI